MSIRHRTRLYREIVPLRHRVAASVNAAVVSSSETSHINSAASVSRLSRKNSRGFKMAANSPKEQCPECGMSPSFDGMWHKKDCSMPPPDVRPSNHVTLESLDEAIRCIGLKMEVRKQRHWTSNMVMWAEIGEIQTLLDWIAERRAHETSGDFAELDRRRIALDEAYDLLTCARPAEHLEDATPDDWYDQRAAWYARNTGGQSSPEEPTLGIAPPTQCSCPYVSPVTSLVINPACPVHGASEKATDKYICLDHEYRGSTPCHFCHEGISGVCTLGARHRGQHNYK
jgi:hypothetical protein